MVMYSKNKCELKIAKHTFEKIYKVMEQKENKARKVSFLIPTIVNTRKLVISSWSE